MRLWQIPDDVESAGGAMEHIAICTNMTPVMIVIVLIIRIAPKTKTCVTSG